MSKYITPDPRDPAYGYMTGNPPEVIAATASPRILIINLHPPEHLAARIAHHIYTERPDLAAHVDFINGHPLGAAAMPQVRYLYENAPDEADRGTDLNRSFDPAVPPHTYEQFRAAELIGPIRTYNAVLDMHTTTTTAGSTGRFLLVTRPDDARIQAMIAASPVKRVVVMSPSIVTSTIIGQVPQSIGIEYNQEIARSGLGVTESIITIENLIRGKLLTEPMEREFYYVTRPIPRAEDPGITTPNFELCKDGYYPVLLGDNSYRRDPSKPYVGFAATRKELVLL